MSSAKSCPECRQALLNSMTQCVCGWKRANTMTVKQRDYRCEFSLGALRCFSVGSVSVSIHGDGTWYCRGHWGSLNDPKRAEAILLESEKQAYEMKEL